jgi:glycosyltransferase involved in cell wall biosynthesis
MKQEVSIIHSHFLTDATLIAPTAHRLKIPHIITVHGFDVTSAMQWPGRVGDRYRRRAATTLRTAQLVIAVSEPIAERARMAGARSDKLKVLYSGVPDIPSSVSDNEKIDAFDVLFVGRLVAKKGLSDLLEALMLIEQPLRVGIVGEGPLEQACRAAAASSSHLIQFLGGRSPTSVKALMEAAGLLALPSKTASDGDMEGLPTVAVEAARAGLPVVGYRHSGIPEIVESGVNGLLCEEGDIPSLARGIQSVLNNPSIRAAYSQGARERFLQAFRLEDSIRRLRDIYSEVGSGNASG